MQLGQGFVRDFATRGIPVGVQGRFDHQAFGGLGMADQFDDRLDSDHGVASPVLRDEREQAVLDFVPLAGAGRKVAHSQAQPRGGGQVLQRHFPQSAASTVAPSTVGHDQQRRGVREARVSHFPPPPQDRGGGELCGVMINADAHPAFVVLQIVHPIRNRLAQGLIDEVVDADFLRAAARAVFPAPILEVADQFLFLRVHRDGGLAAVQEALAVLVNLLELGGAVGMRTPFARLAGSLQTKAGFVQQRGHGSVADQVRLPGQLPSQFPCALDRPAQWRFRVPARGRFHQGVQCGPQARVLRGYRLTAAARAANAQPLRRAGGGATTAQFRDPGADRSGRQSRSPGHTGRAAPAQFQGLRGGPQPPRPFIQGGLQPHKLPMNPVAEDSILHAPSITQTLKPRKTKCNKLFPYRPLGFSDRL